MTMATTWRPFWTLSVMRIFFNTLKLGIMRIFFHFEMTMATTSHHNKWISHDKKWTRKKNPKKSPKERPVWVRGPSPPMADHVLDLVFKLRPLIIGVHVGVDSEFGVRVFRGTFFLGSPEARCSDSESRFFFWYIYSSIPGHRNHRMTQPTCFSKKF